MNDTVLSKACTNNNFGDGQKHVDETVNEIQKEDRVDEQVENRKDKEKELDDREPIFEIKFYKRQHFQNIHEKLLAAIQKELKFEYSISNDFRVSAFNSTLLASKESIELQSAEELSDLFTIDTVPADNISAVSIPSYKRAVKDVLKSEAKKKKDDNDVCERPRNGTACFNCGEFNHGVRDCPQPRNSRRIKRAKKIHASKTERYHVDVEQRFAHIRPGSVSTNLRSALGLRRGEVPFFFYRMRVLGYPPGWLEEAKVEESGMHLFNADGSKILKSDEDEEGLLTDNNKYDVSKIIDFPGYNLHPGEKFYDDYKYHNVPPFHEQFLKANFIHNLGDNVVKSYKRRKLKRLPSAHDTSMETATDSIALENDMEIEDTELIESALSITVSSPSTEKNPTAEHLLTSTPHGIEKNISVRLEKGRESPTLDDLKAKQEALLQQLQVNTSVENSLESSPSTPNTTAHTGNCTTNPPTSPGTAITPTLERISIFKETHVGTPILKFSPYDRLPVGSKFKVGVSDIINFENLPDSTGKYEQMKGVIKNVRNIISELHNSNDD